MSPPPPPSSPAGNTGKAKGSGAASEGSGRVTEGEEHSLTCCGAGNTESADQECSRHTGRQHSAAPGQTQDNSTGKYAQKVCITPISIQGVLDLHERCIPEGTVHSKFAAM